MAFQIQCSSIIIDATLTDLGRQKLARGTFKISKFGVGDDEVDYAGGTVNTSITPPWEISDASAQSHVLEASRYRKGNIKYGLQSYHRQDILYVPLMVVNNKINGSVSPWETLYLVSVNDETTKKIKADASVSADPGMLNILENNSFAHNFLFIEGGIDSQGAVTTTSLLESAGLNNSIIGKERYVTNLGLQDEHVFVYCDGRLVDSLLSNREGTYIKNDSGDNLYTNIVPLQGTVKISLEPPYENFETYYTSTISNELFDDFSMKYTKFMGPSSMACALNFKLNSKLISESSEVPDQRYSTFGEISKTLFATSNKYDYIDTSVMIEGATTGNRLIVPLRIIRYAGT
jgi:hypothetical protein